MQERLGIEPEGHGRSMFSPEQLVPLFQEAHAAGWQIATHTHGDRVVRETPDLYARTVATSPRADHRHRIEHLALLQEASLVRAAELGVTPSFQVNHLYY